VQDDPEASHDIEQVLISSRRALDLVRQMLVFSRQKSLKREPCDLRAVISRAASLLEHRLTPGMRIETGFCEERTTVMADPGQMQQVFLNLGQNAIKAMEDGGGTISITCGTIEFPDPEVPGSDRLSPGTYVRARVSDQGVGIEEEVLGRIFDPFFSTRGVSVASGLGLSVVHGIVKNHDGMIRVESAPGRGTTFEIFLPVVHAAPEPGSVGTEAAPGEEGVVLLVDDERTVADMLATMIERLGFETEVCYDSVEALERFSARPERFALVFLDEVMPVMRGTELARKVRGIRPDVPVVVCSGYSGDEVDIPAEVDVWLGKPVGISELERVLRGLVSP
jgi:CheY-like chemotaxis protein